MPTSSLRITWAAATVSVVLAACAGSHLRPFPLADTVWVDDDEHAVEEVPGDYFSGFVWDAVDQTFFIPTSRYLSLDVPREAVNVNAMDEVPNSSWFTNRIGLFPMSEDALARGACPDDRLDEQGPWTVTAAKPNGANPGFIIRDADGRGWLLKFDGEEMHERATTADVFGSRVYHAAGYWAPCNIVVYFDPTILSIADDATVEDAVGRDMPMEEHHVQQVLDAGIRLDDGRYRASASLFLPGRPVGPFTYQGRRHDDPNDAIRHQDRRELRGAEVLAAWLNHFDAREQNSLTIVVEEGERSFLRHYYLDFGDCLGSRWDQEALTRRFGMSFYFDIAHVAGDFFSFGAITRPWESVSISSIAPPLGYFDAEHLDPARYHAGYPNPAFAAARAGDNAWMARILTRFDEPAIRAMLEEGRVHDRVFFEELVRTLLARRQRLLEYHLTQRSPLANFEVQGDGTTVCFEDLAASNGVTDPRFTRYDTFTWTSGEWVQPRWTRHEPDPDDPRRVCLSLVGDAGQRPHVPAGTPSDALARYQVTDIAVIPEPGSPALPPARLHLYDLGDAGFRLVGIERPADNTPPGRTR